jgi:hypothetical protein
VPHLLNLLNREETVAKVMIQKGPGYHEIDGPKPDAAHAAADEAEQLDFPGGRTRTEEARRSVAGLPRQAQSSRSVEQKMRANAARGAPICP